jgi:hypothetical protein
VLRRTTIALLSMIPLEGCGVVFQLIAGYDVEETRVETVDHALEIATVPKGARVYSTMGDERDLLGETPLAINMPYDVEVTVERPAPMGPFWIGTALDLVAVVGTGFAVREVNKHVDLQANRDTLWSAYVTGPVLSLISEAIVGVILTRREPSVVKRHARPETAELAIERPGVLSLLVGVQVPAIGPRVTIPLDVQSALRLNHPGAPLTIVLSGSATITPAALPSPH